MINPIGGRVCDIIKKSATTCIYYNQKRTAIYHKYRHGPTKTSNPEPDEKIYLQWIKESMSKEGWSELKDFSKSVGRNYMKNFYGGGYNYVLGKTTVFEHFDSNDSLRKWKVGADSDSFHGYSRGELVRSPDGHALFRGVLDNRKPDDGLTENSGFVAMMGPNAPKTRFFQFSPSWDWTAFNTVELRFRGDGRTYQFVVNVAQYSNDLSWYDMYAYPLPTRGGPYWQTIRIPFKNLIFCYKNMPQDEQSVMSRINVKFVAISIQDRNDGPFALEIDYMGLRNDYYTIQYDQLSPYETYMYAHIKYRQITLGCDPPEN